MLNDFLPDVYIYTDHLKGAAAGASPGFGIQLIASSTAGCVYGAQRCTGAARGTPEALASASDGSGPAPAPVPEDVGRAVAAALLDEIARGGCVDTHAQPLVFTLMALCPEDVSRVRVGQLAPAGIETLRLLRSFFGIAFKLKPEAQRAAPTQPLPDAGAGAGAGAGADGAGGAAARKRERSGGGGDDAAPALVPRALMSAKDATGGHSGNTVLVSCLGIGFRNNAKKVT